MTQAERIFKNDIIKKKSVVKINPVPKLSNTPNFSLLKIFIREKPYINISKINKRAFRKGIIIYMGYLREKALRVTKIAKIIRVFVINLFDLILSIFIFYIWFFS